MRTGKDLTRIIVGVLAGLAIGIPTAQASGQSPDSRPYYRGTDPALAPISASPDDRSFDRAIAVSSKTIIVSPDDRAFTRSTPVEPTPYAQGYKPVGFRPAASRALPAMVSVQPRGFDWGDALIGGSFGLAVALLGAGAVAIGLHHRRNNVVRTA